MRSRLGSAALVAGLAIGVWTLCSSAGSAARTPRKRSVKQLIQQLQHPKPKLRRIAARLLSQLPPRQLSTSLLPLIEQLLQKTTSPAAIRNYACDILARMGPKAASTLPTLQQVVLQDPSFLVQMAAINAMSKMGTKAVYALIKMVKSRQDTVRIWAAGALARMGKIAQPAVPELIPLLKDKRWNIRWSGILALSKIGHYPPKLRTILLPMLRSRQQLIRVTVCRIFARMKWPGVLPELLATSRAPDWLMRAESIKALGQIGVSNKAVKQRVREALRDKHGRVRAAAIGAWAALEGKRADSMKPLMLLQRDPSPKVRIAWLQALSRFSLSRKVTEGFLLAAFGDSKWNVRKQAAIALGQRKQLSQAAIAAMIKQLRKDNGFVMQGLMKAFQQMGPRAVAAAPALIELFQRRNRLLQRWLQRTLLRIGPAAMPALIRGMGAKDWHVSRGAARVSVAIGAPAVPALQKALSGASYKQRHWAAFALGKIGAAARPALPALQKATRDPHALVRDFARFAIQKINAAITATARRKPPDRTIAKTPGP